jgi:hypothetical protein
MIITFQQKYEREPHQLYGTIVQGSYIEIPDNENPIKYTGVLGSLTGDYAFSYKKLMPKFHRNKLIPIKWKGYDNWSKEVMRKKVN